MKMFYKNEINLFQKMFLLIATITIIPCILISSINYYVSRNTLESEVGKSNLDILRQARTAVDKLLESTEYISIQITGNLDVQEFWQRKLNISLYDDIKIIKKSINQAQIYLEGNSYISKIYIYSYLNDLLVSSDGDIFHGQDNINMKNLLALYKENRENIFSFKV